MGRVTTGGAPLLALFEKWAATETDTAAVLVLRSRRSNLRFQHFPLVHLHRPRFTEGISSKAAPIPKFGGRHQSALDRIAMHVAEFLDPFPFRPHVEIVKALLPDVLQTVVEETALFRIAFPFGLRHNAAGQAEFEGLQDRRRVLHLWFAD